jgi:ABC-type methionine transport system ATPase subunit
MLEAQNISFQVGGRFILHDVSLKIEPGKLTALVGPSGGGKSTLLKCLAGLQAPSSGSVIMEGQTVKNGFIENQRQIWPHITAVFQQLFLWPHLTLLENILLPLRLKGQWPIAQQKVDQLLDLFEMHDFVNRHPNQVSGGQRQRAAVIRALALEPKYLLLDEITSALDVEQSAAIIQHLEGLKRRGIGILMITHYLGFLHRSADCIAYMEEGRISEQGDSTILSAPRTQPFSRFLKAFETLENRLSHYGCPRKTI